MGRSPEFSALFDMDSITRTLWLRARGGDRAAYDRLFTLHADRALMFIRARLGPKMCARVESVDVLQDAYLAAHQAFDGFDYKDEGAFRGGRSGSSRIDWRDLNDYLGAKKRHAIALPVPDPATGPVTAADRTERRDALVRGIGSAR